jgi:hypothetical protein
MGSFQIVKLHQSLESAQWQEDLRKTRLMHVASQGSSKEVDKVLKPIQREIDMQTGQQDNNDGQIANMLSKLSGN